MHQMVEAEAETINASQRNAVPAEKLNESLKDSKDSTHWVQFESQALSAFHNFIPDMMLTLSPVPNQYRIMPISV